MGARGRGDDLEPGAQASVGRLLRIFRDPDGHSWEIEHNPYWTVHDDGSTTLGT